MGPPGWHTHQPMSARVRPWSARNSSTSSRRYRSTIVGHRGVEHDAQALRGDVEAHGALGVGVEPAAGGQHVERTRPAGPAPATDHRGGAVAEEAAGDQVRHRDVVALHGQRAQLDGDQHGDVVGMAEQVVVHPGDAGGAGDAAEPDQRHPLDVGPQPDLGGDPGLEDRHGQPGDGGARRPGRRRTGSGPAALRASTRAREPSSTACSMKRSLAVPKSPSSAYCSSGSTTCRDSTPALRCSRRSTASSKPPWTATTRAKASVSCCCG